MEEDCDSKADITDTLEKGISSEVIETGEDFVGDHSERSLDEEMEDIMDLKGCSLSDGGVFPASNKTASANEPPASTAIMSGPCTSVAVEEENNSATGNQVHSMEMADGAIAGAAQNDNFENDEGFVEEEISDGDDNSNEDDDDEGWITPGNIGKIKIELQQDRSSVEAAGVTVGCMTSDFAIQV